MTKNKELGEKGEKKAQEYLKNKGYKILAINYSNKHGEIDIIAEYEGLVVFVEVKTMTENYIYKPEDHFDKRKRLALKKTINYIMERDALGLGSIDVRFDLVALTYGKNNCLINHYENIELW